MNRRRWTILGLCLGSWLGGGSPAAQGAQPALGLIMPFGVQRGSETEVHFDGARLGDARQLLFYSPGITVKKLVAENDNRITATLAVAPDCRLGIHAVRVVTASGISDLRTFAVGSLPQLDEVEPNSDFAKPQSVPRECTVQGTVENEDVDHFVIEAKKGERIVAELEGLRLGYTFFDPYLAILNTERFELARSDDSPLLRQDGVCAVVAPADGKYIIQVRECAYGGDGNCHYRLHIGRFPRPTAVFPAGGKPGETLTIRWLGDPAGEWAQEITLPSVVPEPFGLYAQDAGGIAPSANGFRVVDLPNILEAEPNDGVGQATPAAAPGAFNGVLQQPGDVDCFRFAAKKGQAFEARVYARNILRSPLDSVLTIVRSNGAGVAGNDDSGGPDSLLQFTAPEDDEYVAMLRDHLGAGGPTYVYRLEIRPIQPELTMGLPERAQYVATTLSVPRANRVALMVSAARANFGGDLNVSFDGLPAGMTAQVVPMTANLSEIPVLFSAAADAPIDGALVDVVGRPVDANLPLVGHLRQRTMLVRGQNNIDVWGHDADRMAAAVTQEVPFGLDIVQPQVPIVRDGNMNLKIVAQRRAGFDGPISVQLLYAPPGIGASGSIAIPAGQSEALIPLTANGGAAIGSWPLIVTGQAQVGNGSIEVASQMAQLVIADSLFNFTFEKAAGEQGHETDLVVRLEKKRDFEGTAKIELLGLPANTSTKTLPEASKDTAEIAFKIQLAKEARPGIYRSLVCRATLIQGGEPIVQTTGTGELRVDEPLPPKPQAVAAAPAQPQPAPQPAAAAAPKRLSRLEQLRLERQQQKPGGRP